MERVFNEDKTQELTEYDLTLGKLVKDKLFVKHHEAVPEVVAQTVEEKVAAYQANGQSVEQHNGTYYLVVAQYPNGGKDIEEIFPTEAVPAKEAYDEYEDIYVYIPYTEEELLENKKNALREERKVLLEAFDKWEKAVLRGREKDDTSIMNWYRDLLNLVESAFLDENVPERVRYYLGR